MDGRDVSWVAGSPVRGHRSSSRWGMMRAQIRKLAVRMERSSGSETPQHENQQDLMTGQTWVGSNGTILKMALRLLACVLKDGSDPEGAALVLKPERRATENIVLGVRKLRCWRTAPTRPPLPSLSSCGVDSSRDAFRFHSSSMTSGPPSNSCLFLRGFWNLHPLHFCIPSSQSLNQC